ncbi:MAG: ParB family chromosome partitioning protein [Bradymonadia bacterium]|jgi:ParB family chromosome partitioning protein
MDGQPRRHFDTERLNELAQSLRETGIIQPLVVRRNDEGDGYTLIAGERRWRASQLAGLTHVPVVVREVTDRDAFALALIENIQREDLNPIEEALAFSRLIEEHEFRQEDLAQRVGKSRSGIANALRLLKLSPVVRDLVADGILSAGHARAVLSVEEDLQPLLAERIVTEQLSVRQAEDLARQMKNGASAEKPAADSPKSELSPQLKSVQRKLMEHFGSRVVLNRKPNGAGSLEVHYADDAGLQALLDVIYTE